MNCITYVDDEFCGGIASLSHDGLWLCPDHALSVQMDRKKTKALAAVKSTERTGIYILRTPYGTLKIGASNSLGRRLADLHRAFRLRGEYLELLAWDPDCLYLDESVLHLRYWDFLLTDREGEQFEDVTEIRDEAASIGIDPSAGEALSAYHGVKFSGGSAHKRLYLPPSERLS